MHLLELTFCVGDDGHILIPAKELFEMGITLGDNVTMAFLSDDGVKNSYREFLIYANIQKKSVDDEPQTIRIPIELLNTANILANEDIDITCDDGVILILRADKLYLADLDEVLRRLGLMNEELISLIQNKQRPPGIE